MNVFDRIEWAPACEVINLTKAEKDAYNGCGWRLANFHDGTLVALFDPLDVPTIEIALEAARFWMEDVTGEVWLVMCAGYQLCEPRRITATDAGALAHMARVFGEQFAE